MRLFNCDKFGDIQLCVATCRLLVQQVCRLVSHGSWVTRVMGHGSLVTWVVGHGSWVTWVMGHESIHGWVSWVTDHIM